MYKFFCIVGGSVQADFYHVTKVPTMTQILIQIHSAAVRVIPYTDKKTGHAAELRAQTAYLHSLNEDGQRGPVPDKFEILLPKGQTAGSAAGLYTLHPSAIYVDRNGRLQVAPRLAPVPATAKA